MASIGGTSIGALLTATLTIRETDVNGLALSATCVGVPPTTPGIFAKGCQIIRTDSGDGVKALYENVGTTASITWNLIGDVTPGEISLATGSTLIGVAGLATAVDISGSGKILVGNGTTATAVTLSGDASIAPDGALTIASGTVSSTQLQDQAVTAGKLVRGTNGQFPVGVTGADMHYVAMSGGATMDANGVVTLVSPGVADRSITPLKPGLEARNETNFTIPAFSLLYVSGWSSTDVPLIALADPTSKSAVYVSMAAILSNANATVGQSVTIHSLNTLGHSIGDPVYLSSTPGAWSYTPTAGGAELGQVVGYVTVVDASAGAINIDLVSGSQLAIGTNQMKDGSVSAAKIATDAVTNTKISDQAVSAAKIIRGGVGEIIVGRGGADNHFVPLSGAATMDENGVVALATNAVGTTQLATSAVIASKITPEAVTMEKIVRGGEAEIIISQGSSDNQYHAITGAITMAASGVTSLNEGIMQVRSVNVSAADIAGMAITAKQLVSAPGAGKAIEFISAVICYNFDTAAFTGGGDVNIQYSSGGTVLATSISDTNSFASAADIATQCVALDTAGGIVLSANTGLEMTNLTAPFVNPGTAAGTAAVKITYRVITLGF